MYIMIVVDDNPADRRGVRSVFEWDKLGIEIIDTCSNGEQAIKIIKKAKVDIVLTDIAMPIVNGIELSEYIREFYPEIKIVFMSCYSDFDYARLAMNMDIYGYVLKPIIPDELLKVIIKVLDEYKAEAKKENEKAVMIKQVNDMLPMVQEQFLRELLLGNYFELDDILKRLNFLKIETGSYNGIYVISLKIEEYTKQKKFFNAEYNYFVAYTIRNIISSMNSNGIVIYPVQFSGKYYSSIIFLESQDGMILDIVDIAVEIYSAILSKLKLTAKIGISRMTGDITKMHDIYIQSMDAVNTLLYGGSNEIIKYELVESAIYTTLVQTVNLEELYYEIKELVNMGDEKDDAEFVKKYFENKNVTLPENYIKSLMMSIVNMLAVAITESGYSFKDVLGSDTIIWEKIAAIETIVNIKQWLLNLFKALREYLADRRQSRASNVVDDIKEIIKERYHEQITVENIAKAIFLSQSYANSIFKKETGKSIFECLVEYRLEMAKKLLMDGENRILDVSEKVGYENKSYFSLMFKKYVGMSPSEFKTRFVTQKEEEIGG